MKLRVVFLCNEYPPFRNGGIGTYTRDVAEGLVQAGHSVVVIGLYHDLSVDKRHDVQGVQLIQLAGSGLGQIGDRLRIYLTVKNIEKTQGIDVLEVQEHGGMLAFWPQQTFPIVVRLHGSVVYFNTEMNERTFKTAAWYQLEKMTLRRATRVVSVSEYTARRTKALFKLDCKIDIIHNGVRLPSKVKTKYESCGEFQVVFAGSLLGKKGFFQLCHAWKRVIERLPNSRLHLAGKDNWNQLTKAQDILGNMDTLVYHGVLEIGELEALYRRMDLGVFPSFSEAFSLAPMEAMAVGIPVVYTKLCSGRELITDGEHGLLVDPSDEQEIADAILAIAEMTTDQRASLGRRGQDHIRANFSIDRLVRDNEKLMLDLVYGSGSRHLDH